MPTTRPLRTPLPPDEQKFKATTLPNSGWVRLHWPGQATAFISKPHHRFSPDGVEVLYAASEERTAALEIFGDRIYQKKYVDIPASEWNVREFTDLDMPPVLVADLFSASGIETAQVDATALEFNDLAVPRAWAASVHAQGLHGLLYASRFTRKKCIALFAVLGNPPPVPNGVTRSFRTTHTARRFLRDYNVSIT